MRMLAGVGAGIFEKFKVLFFTVKESCLARAGKSEQAPPGLGCGADFCFIGNV